MDGMGATPGNPVLEKKKRNRGALRLTTFRGMRSSRRTFGGSPIICGRTPIWRRMNTSCPTEG
jgi:hypothetical protein